MQKHFPGQLPDETICRVLHRHWFNLASHFFVIFFLFLGIIIFSFLAPFILAFVDIVIAPGMISFITSTALLFLWVYAFFVWIDYYFDVWVITNERVLNIEQKGLFTRVVSEVHMGRIQDVTTKTEGFLPTILNYGDIFVQTAGEEKRFHFRNIADPDKYKDEIVGLAKKVHEKKYSSFSRDTESL